MSQTVELPIWWEKENNSVKKGDESLGRMLHSLFEDAREAQRPDAARWKKADRFYRGKQWERQLEKWRAQITVNVCFPIVENQLAVMADSTMRASIKPVEGGDLATAMALDYLLQYVSQRYEWPLEFVMGQKTSLKYGSAVFKVGWDPDAGLEGDVSLTRISPKCFFPDPMAKSLKDARYVFEAKIMTIAEVKKLHGKAAEGLSADDGLKEMEESAQQITEIKEVSKVAYPSLTAEEENGVYLGKGIQDLLRKVLYVECWIRDESYKKEKGEGGDEDKVPVYPGGRHICFVGQKILKDEKNPFWHGEWPYAVLPNYPDDESFWGIGEIDNIVSIQQEINKRRSQVSDNATAHGNPVWLKDARSGVKASELSGRPDLVVTHRTGTKIERLNPPQIPQYVVDGHGQSIADAEYVSGMHEIMQGKQPGSVRDFSAMRTVQEIAERRPRTKLEFHQATLRRIGRIAAALFMQFYESDRWERILGQDFYRTLLEARVNTEPCLNVNEDDETVHDELSFQLEEVYEQYDYTAEAEPMTRNTRELKREQLKDLRNIIGPALDEVLLREYNIEDWETIVKKAEDMNAPKQEPPPAPEQLMLPEAPPEAPMPPPQPPPAPPPDMGMGGMGMGGGGAPPGDIPPELLQMMMAGGQPPAF